MARWIPPDGVNTDATVLRAYVGAAKPGERSCPQRRAAKARPQVMRALRQQGKRRGLNMVGVRVVNDLLDMVEFEDEMTIDRALGRIRSQGGGNRRLHPAMTRWAVCAATRWVEAGRELDHRGGAVLGPTSREWVVQWQPADVADSVTLELCAWGRRYASVDGAVRELRIPRVRSVRERATDVAEAATAAFVVATGREPKVRVSFEKPYVLRDHDPAVRLVRVIEVGCEDGSHNIMFEGPPGQAVEIYRRWAKAQVTESVNGGEYRPGYDCADCALVALCPAVPKRPGLLGLDDQTMPRRSWSATDGRYYAACPAKEYQRRASIPTRAGIESVEVRRGRAVHEWLEACHRRLPVRGCVPDGASCDQSWGAGWSLTGDDAGLAVQMVCDHAAVCPVHDGLDESDVRVEEYVVVYDPAADVVVVAKPDLAYRDGNSWVLREVKTQRRAGAGIDLLRKYPQLAVGLLLLAEGILGSDVQMSRVELERLTGEGPLVTVFNPNDPLHLTEARSIVHELVKPWHVDLRSDATPGDHCRGCEFTSSCPDAATTPNEMATI